MRILSILLMIIGLGVAAFGGWTWYQQQDQVITDEPIERFSQVIEEPEAPPPPLLERSAEFAAASPQGVLPQAAESRDDILARLKTVPIAYEKPSEVEISVPFDVTLAIDGTGQEGGTAAVDALDGVGDVVEAEVKVSRIVSARLTGTGFRVQSLSPERQTLSPLEVNRWSWSVEAEEEGDQRLTLEIYAHVDDETMPVRTYRDTITVSVSPLSRILSFATQADPVVAVVGGLGSLIAGLFGAVRFFRPGR